MIDGLYAEMQGRQRGQNRHPPFVSDISINTLGVELRQLPSTTRLSSVYLHLDRTKETKQFD